MSTRPYLMVKGTVVGSTPWRSRLRRRSGHEWMTTFLTWTTRKTRFNIHFCRKGHPSFAHAYGHVRPTDISLLEGSIRTRRPSAARSPSPTMCASAAASLLLSPSSFQGTVRPKNVERKIGHCVFLRQK
jgi:hypothetical protein